MSRFRDIWTICSADLFSTSINSSNELTKRFLTSSFFELNEKA